MDFAKLMALFNEREFGLGPEEVQGLSPRMRLDQWQWVALTARC